MLAFLAELSDALAGPIRDAETLDGLRASFRRIWRFLTVMPAERVEDAEDSFPGSEFVIFPRTCQSRSHDLTTALPTPANRYSEGLLTQYLSAPLSVPD